MGVEVAAAVMIGSAAVSAYGTYQQSQAQAKALREQSKAKKMEAREVQRRFEINRKALRMKGEEVKGEQLAAAAASGVDVTSGTPVTLLEDTEAKIIQQIEYETQATSFSTEQAIRSADFTKAQAGRVQTAGTIAAFGQLAGGSAHGASKLG
jgi:hypothetical protein